MESLTGVNVSEHFEPDSSHSRETCSKSNSAANEKSDVNQTKVDTPVPGCVSRQEHMHGIASPCPIAPTVSGQLITEQTHMKEDTKTNVRKNRQDAVCNQNTEKSEDVPVCEAVQKAHNELTDHWLNLVVEKEQQLKKLRTNILNFHLNECRIDPTVEEWQYRVQIQENRAANLEKKLKRLKKTTDFRWVNDDIETTDKTESEEKFIKKLKLMELDFEFLEQFLIKCRAIFGGEKYRNMFGQHWQYPQLYRDVIFHLIDEYHEYFGEDENFQVRIPDHPTPDYVMAKKRRSGYETYRVQFDDSLFDFVRCGTVQVLPRVMEVDEIARMLEEGTESTLQYRECKETGSSRTSPTNVDAERSLTTITNQSSTFDKRRNQTPTEKSNAHALRNCKERKKETTVTFQEASSHDRIRPPMPIPKARNQERNPEIRFSSYSSGSGSPQLEHVPKPPQTPKSKRGRKLRTIPITASNLKKLPQTLPIQTASTLSVKSTVVDRSSMSPNFPLAVNNVNKFSATDPRCGRLKFKFRSDLIRKSKLPLNTAYLMREDMKRLSTQRQSVPFKGGRSRERYHQVQRLMNLDPRRRRFNSDRIIGKSNIPVRVEYLFNGNKRNGSISVSSSHKERKKTESTICENHEGFGYNTNRPQSGRSSSFLPSIYCQEVKRVNQPEHTRGVVPDVAGKDNKDSCEDCAIISEHRNSENLEKIQSKLMLYKEELAKEGVDAVLEKRDDMSMKAALKLPKIKSSKNNIATQEKHVTDDTNIRFPKLFGDTNASQTKQDKLYKEELAKEGVDAVSEKRDDMSMKAALKLPKIKSSKNDIATQEKLVTEDTNIRFPKLFGDTNASQTKQDKLPVIMNLQNGGKETSLTINYDVQESNQGRMLYTKSVMSKLRKWALPDKNIKLSEAKCNRPAMANKPASSVVINEHKTLNDTAPNDTEPELRSSSLFIPLPLKDRLRYDQEPELESYSIFLPVIEATPEEELCVTR